MLGFQGYDGMTEQGQYSFMRWLIYWLLHDGRDVVLCGFGDSAHQTSASNFDYLDKFLGTYDIGASGGKAVQDHFLKSGSPVASLYGQNNWPAVEKIETPFPKCERTAFVVLLPKLAALGLPAYDRHKHLNSSRLATFLANRRWREAMPTLASKESDAYLLFPWGGCPSPSAVKIEEGWE